MTSVGSRSTLSTLRDRSPLIASATASLVPTGRKAVMVSVKSVAGSAMPDGTCSVTPKLPVASTLKVWSNSVKLGAAIAGDCGQAERRSSRAASTHR